MNYINIKLLRMLFWNDQRILPAGLDSIFSAMSAGKMSVSVCVCPWLRENIQDAVTDGELIYERG